MQEEYDAQNDNEEEDEGVGQGFQRATAEQMAKRKIIKTAKRLEFFDFFFFVQKV